MKLADSHIHLFRNGFPGRYGPLFPKGVEPVMYGRFRALHSVERALVVGYEGSEWSGGNNRYILGLSAVQCWIVPLAFCRASGMPKWIRERLGIHEGFAGVSLYPATETDAASLSRWPHTHFDSLNELSAIVSINCPAHVASHLRPFLEHLGGTRVLLSHLGLPGPVNNGALPALDPILGLAALPHVGVKLSGAYAWNAYPHSGLASLLTALRGSFGEQRLYWGSDFSPALDFVTFEQSIESIKTQPWQSPERIFHNNLADAIARTKWCIMD